MMQPSITDNIKIAICFWAIAWVCVRYGTLILEDKVPHTALIAFMNQPTSIFPNSRVFTPQDGSYSLFLGGTVEVFAKDTHGDIIQIPLHTIYRTNLNHSYTKTIDKVVQKTTKPTMQPLYSQEVPAKLFCPDPAFLERSVRQLFCKNNYQYIELKRVFILQSPKRTQLLDTRRIICQY